MSSAVNVESPAHGRCPIEFAQALKDAGQDNVWIFQDQTLSRPSLVAFGTRMRVSVYVGSAVIEDCGALLSAANVDRIMAGARNDPWREFDYILQIPEVAAIAEKTPALFHVAFEATHFDESVGYPPGVSEDTLLAEFVLPANTVLFPTDSLDSAALDDEGKDLGTGRFVRKETFKRGSEREAVNVIAETPTSSYRDAFETVVKHIARGDAYQVVIGQAVHHKQIPDPLDLYRQLVKKTHVPYGFKWPLSDGRTLVGASPESFARSDGTELHLRPLAGTVSRTGDERVDASALRRFTSDAKELGEHLMLLDLCRDDIAVTCIPGTLEVRNEFEVESYQHVFHFASHISGQLDRRRGPFSTMRRLFPAGTMTGAPRLRAMEIIAAVEPEPRGPYAGIVGYVYADGRFDSGICIRMVEISPTGCTTRAAGGVLWDSSIHGEWEELKAKLAGCDEAVKRHYANPCN